MASDPQTYAQLQASLANWTDDSTLTATLPEIIALTERRLSRRISSPEMEAITPIALTDGTALLPGNILAIRSLYIDYQGYRTPLNEVSEADFDLQYTTNTGRPINYSVIGLSLYVWPLPDLSYALTMRYKQMIPALSSDAPTNWLLTKWPDLYLFACLQTAFEFGFESDKLDYISGKADLIMAEVNDAGRKLRYGDGPLVPRAPVGDYSVSPYALWNA